MRRNRVLTIFAVLFAMSTAVFWLGNVLAAATISINAGLTVEEASSSAITSALLLAEDPDAPGAIITYTLVTTPTNGSLLLNGTTTLAPTGQFNQSDIDNGFLAYVHDDSETLADSFDFTAETSATTTSQATFEITITPIFDQQPTVLNQTFSVDENSPTGTPVDTVVATDLDAGDALSYTIIGGNFGTPFALDIGTGAVTVNSEGPLDFETNQSLTFTVQVEDRGALIDTAEITVDINDINEPPTISGGPFTITENETIGTFVGTVITSDVDANESFTYSIIGGDPLAAFAIDSSGDITVNDSDQLDYETTPTYTLTVEVEDSGMNTDSADIVIDIIDENEPPSTSNITYTPNENLANNESVGFFLANDPEEVPLTFSNLVGNTNNAFAVSSTTGEITVNDTTQLNFEENPTFTLTVDVDDGVNPAETATAFINLVDLNEEPTVNDNSFSINENLGNGSLVGTVTASDPDTADMNALIFGLSTGNTGNAFAINNNGQITVADTNQLDYETNPNFMLGVIVTDTGGLQDTATVTINLNNLYDEAPTVNNATFNVSEGSANGVVVGTVSATDPEFASGDALTFSITGGNTGTVFAINSTTGQITVPDTSKLDADVMPTFNLTIRAIDKGGQIDTGIITINVSALPISYIFVPTMLNNYPPVEPNDLCSQAYGLGPGTDYEFTSDDIEDWYVFTLSSAANPTVILSSFEPSQGQLIMYSGSCNNPTLLGNNGNPSTTKTLNFGTLAAGTYYIRVYSVPVTNTTYTLRINLN